MCTAPHSWNSIHVKNETSAIGLDVDPCLVDFGAKKLRILFMLLAYSALLGVICIFLPEADVPLHFVVGLPLLFLGISWCYNDASQGNHRISKLVNLTLLFWFLVGFPVYIFQTRGIRGFKTLLLALCFVALMTACALTTMCVGYAVGLGG
jgi:hypothetical protein